MEEGRLRRALAARTRERDALRAELDAAQALQVRTEVRLRRLVDANLLPILIATADGRIFEANDAFLAMVGYTRGDLAAGAVRWDTLTPPEWAHLDARAFAQFAVEGLATPWEKELVRKDGSRVPVLVGATATGGGSGESIAFAVDLSERKRAEAALARRNEVYELLGLVSRRLLDDELGGDGVRSALEALGRFLHADLAQRFTVHDDRTFEVCEQWAAPDAAPVAPIPRTRIPSGDHGWLTARLLRGEVIRLPSLAALPGEGSAARRAILASGIRSGLIVPLSRNGAVTGWLGLGFGREIAAFSDEDVSAAELVAEIVAIGLLRAQAQRAVVESEARYRTLVEQSLDATFTLGLDGSIVYASPAAEAIFGYAAEEWTGRRGLAFEIVLPEYVESLRRFVASGAQIGGHPQWGWRRKDGGVVFTESVSSIIRDPAGVPIGVQVIARDITDRKLADERLRRQVTREALVAHAARRFLHEPSDPAIDAALDALLGHLGADRASVLEIDEAAVAVTCSHQRCAAGVPSTKKRIVRVPLEQAPGLGEVLQGQVVRLDRPPERGADEAGPSSGAFGIEAYLAVPLGTAGRVRGALAVAHTRSPRLWTDEDVSLARLVGELVAVALLRRDTEATLIEARNAAEAASLSKSRFLANMSHEIRTPLNGVIGMVDLLGATELDERQRRYTEVARSSASLLLSVINDVLDFSKIEANRLEIEESELSLAGVLEEVAGVLALSAEDKGLELSCRWAPELAAPLLGDPARIRQVLLNLVGNAIKFTLAGEVRIRAAVQEEAGPSVTVRVEVADTGIGVGEAARARLFQPFSQGDASTTRRHGGSGLGLAISRELVERMGGSIGVESEPGRGSTFWFTVPLRRTDRPSSPLPLDRLRGVRVLGVDDNATNREILDQELTSAGMSCETVSDGPAALVALHLAAAAGRPFAVALVDHHMPGMTGLELVGRIKADPILHGTAIVILGSVGRPLSAAEQRERGVAGYITKPIWRARLLRVIAAALEGATAPLEPRSVTRHDPLEGAGRRVLVVEDSDINAEVALEILAQAGYAVNRVADGRAAIDAALRGGYDVILMDCQLPELDGFEATRRIRDGERVSGRRVPILALTASATREDHARCLASGMDDFVAKPLDAGRLLRLVAAHVTGRTSESLPPSAGGSRAVADVGQALARVRGNAALLGRLAGQLRAVVPVTLDDLRRAVAGRDATAARFLAHRFSGQVSTFEASLLVAELEALRHAAADGRWSDADRQLCEVERGVERLLDALSAEGLG